MTDHTTSVPFETERELALTGNAWTFHGCRTPEGPRVAQLTTDCRWIEGDPSVLVAAIS